MGLKSFFKHLGHAIEHGVKDIVHGVEHVAQDIGHMAKAAEHMVSDLAQLKFKSALNDAVQCASAGVKAFTEMPKAEMDAVCDATSDLHLNKSLDKMAQKVKGLGDKVVEQGNKIAEKTLSGVADSVEGTVTGIVNTAKDLAHGDFGKAVKDGMGAVGNALSVAADLTPEGLAANAVVAGMQTEHIGGEKLQGFVADVVGGPKGLLKRAAESGAGLAANEVAGKVGTALAGAAGPGGGAAGGVALTAMVAAPMLADAIPSRRGHGGHGHEGAPHTVSREVIPPAAGRDSHPSNVASEHRAGPPAGTQDGAVRHDQRDQRDRHEGRDHGAGSAAGSNAASTAASYGEAASTIAAARASAAATMASQDALAAIQNKIALNQAKNSVEDELGKGVKALAQ